MPPFIIQGRFQPGRQHATGPAHPASARHSLLPSASSYHLSLTGGVPLPPLLCKRAEATFGKPFGQVQVHIGPQAPTIGALAFTTGDHMFFAPGQFQPDTPRGLQILGHELAHVVQQRSGRVRHPGGNGPAIVNDPILEHEADRLGLAFSLAGPGNGTAPAAAIQRTQAHLVHPGHRHGHLSWSAKPIQRVSLIFSSDAAGPPTGKRPGDFRPEVKQYMYAGPGGKRATLGNILEHQQNYHMELHQCAECKLYYPQEAINIDHVDPWDNIKVHAGTRGNEIDLFNDIKNLQLLCTSCNLSKQKNAAWAYGGEYREGLQGPLEHSMRDEQAQVIGAMLSGKFKGGTHTRF